MGAPRDDNDEQAELRRGGVLWEQGKAEGEDRNGSSRMRGAVRARNWRTACWRRRISAAGGEEGGGGGNNRGRGRN